MTDHHKTHFGYQEVPLEKKESLVKEVFHSVAPKYDLMNDLMSFGLHRLWKSHTLSAANIRPGQSVLDVASGTGDLALAMVKLIGQSGKVVMTDINESMLNLGRDRLLNAGYAGQFEACLANAENLPFADDSFDCITIAFGLRNVTNKTAALQSMYRVLKPGGKLLILEFSHPVSSLIHKLYDFYSFNIIPFLGEWVANDKESYQYLVESIRMHPNQETLKAMMLEVGLEDVKYRNFNQGIVALHLGYKY